MKKIAKEKDKLRLINWWNDRCPPIDLNASASDVRDLIREVLDLRKELKVTDELLNDRERILDAIPECPVHGKCIPNALLWIEKAKTALSLKH